MDVVPYRPGLASDVLKLIVAFQRDECSIDITAAAQPDLQDTKGVTSRRLRRPTFPLPVP